MFNIRSLYVNSIFHIFPFFFCLESIKNIPMKPQYYWKSEKKINDLIDDL